jgi:hypothetical protein
MHTMNPLMIAHHDGHKKKAHTLQPCFQHVITEDSHDILHYFAIHPLSPYTCIIGECVLIDMPFDETGNVPLLMVSTVTTSKVIHSFNHSHNNQSIVMLEWQ